MLDPSLFVERRQICFFAHYDADGVVMDHVLRYLDALRGAGFAVAVASTAALGAEQQARMRAHCDGLIVRENVGLDFGGWQGLHALLPGIDPDWLLLCNDSVYGPLTDLRAFIDRLTAPRADFYGIVGNLEFALHAQSWFVLLGRAARQSAAFGRLMADRITANMPKRAIIRRFEIGLSADLIEEGLSIGLAYDPRRDGIVSRQAPFNAGHALWNDLIEAGMCPFIKVELLRDNPVWLDDLSQWPGIVAARAPDLVAMIRADLARRPGPARRTLRLRMAKIIDVPPSYMRQFRPLLRNDFRLAVAGRHAALRANAASFRAAWLILYAARLPVFQLRRLYAWGRGRPRPERPPPFRHEASR